MAEPTGDLKIAPSAGLLRYNELNFSNLYLHHTFDGRPNTTQAKIIETNTATGLGQTNVNNWKIYDGVGPDAKVVARAQGLHMYAGKWRCSFSIVFENERFNGSTLEVNGVIVEKGEWAIVGGTGEFKMATGVIYKKLYQQNSDGNIIELTVHGFCPVLLKPYKTGPWGSDTEGKPFEIKDSPLLLVDSITIRRAAVIDCVEFSYIDQAGEKHYEKMGGDGGSSTTITLAPNEYVIQVSGEVGNYKDEVAISKIIFVTNIRSYGPFGDGNGTTSSFTARAEDGYNLAGFFGRAGKYVNTLGFYMHPL